MLESERPKTMPELKERIRRAVDELNQDQAQINRACMHARTRAQMCHDAEGGHLEHKKQGRDRNNDEVDE